MIIDCQLHAYEANTLRRACHRAPNWPDHATGDEMVGRWTSSALSLYRCDASHAVEVQGPIPVVSPS
jgi:hypothetical protein